MEKRIHFFTFGLTLLLMCFGRQVFANVNEEVSDEQLLAYKKTIKEIEAIKEMLRASYKQAILQEQTALSVKRFWALKQAGTNAEKRKKFRSKELTAFENIKKAHTELAETFKIAYTERINRHLGANLYNVITAKLAATPSLRHRYETLAVPVVAEQNKAPQASP